MTENPAQHFALRSFTANYTPSENHGKSEDYGNLGYKHNRDETETESTKPHQAKSCVFGSSRNLRSNLLTIDCKMLNKEIKKFHCKN